MNKIHDRLLLDVPATNRPMFIRGTLLRSIVDQVNRNTIALAPPRTFIPGGSVATNIDGEDEIDTTTPPPDGVGGVTDIHTETSRGLVEVRVENPVDSEQFVNIDRRTFATFTRLDGTKYTQVYINE